MIVEDIMTKAVICGQMTDSVGMLEQLMNKAGVQCLPIIDNAAQCIGVISAIDLIQLHAIQASLRGDVQAWEICTEPVVEISPYQSLTEAAELMVSNKLHHLVVTGAEGLLGIVSSMDILEKKVLRQGAR
ncbi:MULTISPECIES: CBS domain-containing protein [Cycloclasticus]|jgi:CBS-domain-containing membrane protein|uniref:CBS domain protein n=1 Tax=Cycloclasticus zancles 78-ME TaxID=1198232 RepID=S5T7D0_9GAMM|nr:MULTISPECIES: CBS domain-containing protein [Cycloclasticus]AGS39691.1 CBS domain protein [Cycloclasticus zancles 78-ME]MDF1829607.1 CBS domain-containing protein [Cycloclasticus pugetii]SHJ69590.1 CBS domain-containing protein [Cycloclasticus pugetii]|tara:strand:- start:391 stop:780 length:390 start_codon:yes stop_codon:yes gene_type:complete